MSYFFSGVQEFQEFRSSGVPGVQTILLPLGVLPLGGVRGGLLYQTILLPLGVLPLRGS